MVNRFNAINSAKLKVASYALFASTENFSWAYLEKIGELPTDSIDSAEMARVRKEANQRRLDWVMKRTQEILDEWMIPES